MVCSTQKVRVAVKSAKIGASSHVTNSILKNAAKWLVYASTVTYSKFEHLCWLAFRGNEMPTLLFSHRGMFNLNQTSNSYVRIMMKASCG